MNAGCANYHENTVEINKLTSSPFASPWIFSSCLCSGSRNYIFEHFLASLSRLFLLLLSLLCPAPLPVPVQLCVHRPRAAPSLGEQAGPSPSPLCTRGPTLTLRALHGFRVPFQAGAKMGHSATGFQLP